MDILKMLTELRGECDQIVEAIMVLERMSAGRGKRRGRPPAWMTAATAPKRRGRPPGSYNKPKKLPDQTLCFFLQGHARQFCTRHLQRARRLPSQNSRLSRLITSDSSPE